MENNKTRSKGTTALIVLLLLVTMVAIAIASYAWAKYTETLDSASATASVAKWNVKATEDEGFTFKETYTKVIQPNKLAPGTEGKIDVGLDVTGTEVDVNYEIKLISVVDAPTYLDFYSDEACTQKLNKTTGNVSVTTGTIPVTSTDKTATEYIYWKWPYNSGDDEQDTTDGKAAKPVTVTYQITATQAQPEPHE